MWYDETGLPWNPPSPNMRTLATATVYPGTCLFEATNISEGRGTDNPFEDIGAPWIDGAKLSSRLNLPGAKFIPTRFTPRADSMAAPNPKYKDRLCGGVRVRVVDRTIFQPVATALTLLEAVRQIYPDSLQIRDETMDRLAGTSAVRRSFDSDESVRRLLDGSSIEVEKFRKIQSKYLFYH